MRKDLERLQKLMALMFSDNPAEHAGAARQFVESARRCGIHPAEITLVHERDLLGRLNRLNAQLSQENDQLHAETMAWREVAPPTLRRTVAALKRPHFRRWRRFEFLARQAFGRFWKRGACAALGLTSEQLKSFRQGKAAIDDGLMRRLEAFPPYRPRKPKIVWDDWMLDRLQALWTAERSAEEISASLHVPMKSVVWRIKHRLGVRPSDATTKAARHAG